MYQFREVVLRNKQSKRRILVIDFDDPEMKIVGEFLMADAAMLGATVLEEMEQVLQGEKDTVESSGNRCSLTITKETTVIHDLLAGLYEDVAGLPSYEVATDELKALIIEWLEMRKEFYQE